MSEENTLNLSAVDMISMVSDEFGGVDTPVSAEHVAALYGVLAAQSDAMLSILALAIEANPKLASSGRGTAAEQAMNVQIDALSNALMSLARSYGKTESKL